MRLIDADALLEQMKHRKEYVGRPSDPVCLVEDAPTIGGWISAKDRTPDKSEEVILFYEWTGRFSGNKYREVGFGTIADLGQECFVIAWMPIPEPPKEE